MAKIHHLSSLTALPELDLFGVPPTQLSIERDICTEYRPISTLSNSSSLINFEIFANNDEYIQFNKTELMLRIRIDISKKGKIDLKADDWKLIWPVNNLLHSMIKQINVAIGNNDITVSSNNYAYRAYLETLFNYNINAKQNFLTASLWYADKPGNMEEFNFSRNKIIKNVDHVNISQGQEIELIGRLHLDISNQDKAIIGGSKINISITPNDPKFYIMCDDTIKPTVHILDACLFVHKSKICREIIVAHNIALKTTTAKYPIERIDVKSFNVLTGVLDYHINDVHNGVLPRKIFVACVSSDSFNGSLKKNPFNFQHFNIRQIACIYDGYQYPLKAYQPDFENNKFIREYFGLFETLNQTGFDCAPDIDRESYARGFTIFGFNFAPDLNEGPNIVGHVSPLKFGSLRLELKFDYPLPHPINVIVFSEFDSLIEINEARVANKNF